MRKTILLIEDDDLLIDLYTTALEKAGFNVSVISSARDVYDKIKEIQKGKAKPPDLILLNIKIDGINGFDILRRIRENKVTKNLNVFILTNYPKLALEGLGYRKGLREIKNEVFLLKTDWPPSKLVLLIKKRLKVK